VTLILGVILVQILSGSTWWLAARSGHRVSLYEVLGMGLAVGTFSSVIASMFLAQTPLAGVAWALPAVATLPCAWLLRRTGRLDWSGMTIPSSQSWAALISLGAGFMAVAANWGRVPLDAPTTKSFADLYFFEAISRGLAEFGPTQSILMDGGALRYHWFTYAWSGELSQISQAAPFFVLTRVLPLVTLLGVTLIAVSWAGRISKARWVPLLSGLLIVIGGYSGALYGSILNFDSPSQSFTTMWLLAFAIAFLFAIRVGRGLLLPAVAIGLLASALVGGKVSHALVAVGGMLAVTLVLLIQRDTRWRRAIVVMCVAGASMLITYVVVLSGVAVNRNLTEDIAVKASTWQGLDPFVGRVGVALGTIALLLAILTRVAGMAWPRVKGCSIKPDWWFALGGLMVGVAAMLLLSEGVNELWFVLAASAPAAVLSAQGVGSAAHWLRDQYPDLVTRRRASLLLIAVPASLICLALSRNWTQHQSLLNWLAPISVWILVPITALLVAWLAFDRGHLLRTFVVLTICALPLSSILTRPATLWTSQRTITTEAGVVIPASSIQVGGALVAGGVDGAFTEFDTASSSAPAPATSPNAADIYASQRSAAAWIESNTSKDAVLATTDPLSALVPALTGRQMFIAGNRYQVGLGAEENIGTVWARSEASLALGLGPDPGALAMLCSAGGEWIWVAGAASPTWQGSADLVYSNEQVSILRLRQGACSA
jgi:hypothetical protein